MRIEEFLEYVRVFVVDMLDIMLFKEALFGHDNVLSFNFLCLERDVFWIDVLARIFDGVYGVSGFGAVRFRRTARGRRF